MASINHAAAVTLARTWICRGFVATGCLPPAAKHDGGVHDNVDVREPALVESCPLPHWVLQWLQPLGHLCQDLSMTRFCVLCDFLCRTAQAAEAAMSSSKVASSKGSWIPIKICSIPKVIDQHANVWPWITADCDVSAMAVVNATGWPSSQ